jgi:hypothetical protein
LIGYLSKTLCFQAPGLRVNFVLPSSLLLLLFFLPFTWGRHRRARTTTALPGATSLELLILFGNNAKPTLADTKVNIFISLSTLSFPLSSGGPISSHPKQKKLLFSQVTQLERARKQKSCWIKKHTRLTKFGIARRQQRIQSQIVHLPMPRWKRSIWEQKFGRN